MKIAKRVLIQSVNLKSSPIRWEWMNALYSGDLQVLHVPFTKYLAREEIEGFHDDLQELACAQNCMNGMETRPTSHKNNYICSHARNHPTALHLTVHFVCSLTASVIGLSKTLITYERHMTSLGKIV